QQIFGTAGPPLFFPPLVLMMMAIVFTLYSAALTRRGGGNAVFVHRGIWVFHADGVREWPTARGLPAGRRLPGGTGRGLRRKSRRSAELLERAGSPAQWCGRDIPRRVP